MADNPVAVVVPADAAVPLVEAAAAEEAAAEETTEALGMELEELETWLDEQFGALREEIHSLRESLLRTQESSILDRQILATLPVKVDTLTARIEEIYQSVIQWEAVDQLTSETTETTEILPVSEAKAEPEPTKEGNPSTDTKATEPPASESGPGETVAVRKRRLRAI